MMKEEFKIKLIHPEDIENCIELVLSSFDSKYLIPSIYRAKGINEFILSELKNPFSQYRYFVLKWNNELAGYAEYKVFHNIKMVFLNIIAVNNKYKNKGVGNKLFTHAKDVFNKEGIQTIQLDVYNTNTVAINWYKSFGFIKTSSNFLYKIEKSENNNEYPNIFVKNFPQLEIINNTLGFYFIDILMENKNLSIGCIDNDLFLREKYTEQHNTMLSFLSQKMNFRNMYYIGEESNSQKLEFIDKINRLELNLNHD